MQHRRDGYQLCCQVAAGRSLLEAQNFDFGAKIGCWLRRGVVGSLGGVQKGTEQWIGGGNFCKVALHSVSCFFYGIFPGTFDEEPMSLRCSLPQGTMPGWLSNDGVTRLHCFAVPSC